MVSHRRSRNSVSTGRPYAFLLEQEPAANGQVLDTATVFLTGRECPWRCLMCDLWQNTTTERTPPGAIPAQIDFALTNIRSRRREEALISDREDGASSRRRLPLSGEVAHQIKLYNSGSFFDRAAVPVEDYPAIAKRITGFERVVVECHPKLIGDLTWRFRDELSGSASNGPQLEVAMGLETAHPDVLEKLNKRFDLDDFARAAGKLRREHVDLRVFVLVKPPFMDEQEGVDWAVRSAEFAFELGATVVSLIPTRLGNGALEALAQQGHFAPPKLASLEAAFDRCLALGHGRVFADTWDLGKFSTCEGCFTERRCRIEQMNLCQRILPPVTCQCRAD
ncbi:MAG TPA: radical SAM protein [Verrucomicrobiales bacterium]|nr:radical SAM protein [Verrucomicrobiales bacterium]